MRVAKGIVHGSRRNRLCLPKHAFFFRAIPSAHQDAFDMSGRCGLQIADLVSNENRLAGVETEIGDRLQNHARLWLATKATGIGSVGTEVPRVDRGLVLLEAFTQGTIYGFIGSDVVITTANTSLIRNDDNRNTETIEVRDHASDTLNEDKVAWIMQIVDLFVEHSIAIEKQCWTSVSRHQDETDSSRRTDRECGRG